MIMVAVLIQKAKDNTLGTMKIQNIYILIFFKNVPKIPK